MNPSIHPSIHPSIAAIILLVSILFFALISPVDAVDSGDVLGWVRYSDIVVTLDGREIRSYNINGYTYIVVEDLMSFGYDVKWDARTSRLTVGGKTGNIDYSYYHFNVRGRSGEIAFPYYATNVTTWFDGTMVTGYNIGGYTCVCMDDLARFFANTYTWDERNRKLAMTSFSAYYSNYYYYYGYPSYLPTPYCRRFNNAEPLTEKERYIWGRWEGYYFPPDEEVDREQIPEENVAVEEEARFEYAALNFYDDRSALLELEGKRYELTNWRWVDTFIDEDGYLVHEYRADFNNSDRMKIVYSPDLEWLLATPTVSELYGGLLWLF